MQQIKSKEDTDRLTEKYFVEQKKAADYAKQASNMTRKQFEELLRVRSLLVEITNKTMNGHTINDSDVNLFYSTLNTIISKDDQSSHFSIIFVLPSIDFINLDKVSPSQYGKIYQVVDKILRKEDVIIDPFGSIKSTTLHTVCRWFANPKIKFRDKHLVELIESVRKDKRYLVANSAEIAMSNLKKPGSIKP
jgi:hypothetical protein